MSDHIVNPNKMPADGYYSALIQCDTGGEFVRAVEVHGGKVLSPSGTEIIASACSCFVLLAGWSYCQEWPYNAAHELDRLRLAVRALHAELQGGKFAAIPVEDILSGKVTL